MCGRFTMAASRKALLEAFLMVEDAPEAQPRFNVAPTQPILGLVEDQAGKPQWRVLRWGLVPSWAKEPLQGPPLINARCETVAQKPAFRGPFRRHRCLIPADGFFEWQKVGARKQPFYFRCVGHEVFAFAGIWDTWLGPDGSELDSCSLLTTVPNGLVGKVHDRMPVILAFEDHRLWLGGKELLAADRERLFLPFPEEAMDGFPVTPRMGSPAFDGPECVRRLDEGLLL